MGAHEEACMRSKITQFCEEIKVDFTLFLYHKRINFPFCCKLSADMITSFFQMVYDERFQYICTTNQRAYNHAWTYYRDEVGEFIIDFTELQFKLNADICKNIKDNKYNDMELSEIIRDSKVVFDTEETYMYVTYDFMQPKKQTCYGLIKGRKMELTKKCFIEYLQSKYENVYNKTEYY